ncbi:multidrug effflux MFS transporter [Sphingobium boeckii]|uniref:DHA1 family bicyclomycin/chloramphenicol resistance-like MFS transporter n=1 Tax=Sphingobium boeckii TaxID=1082345 RepID=A0A7W9EFV9_9SPHN|nr:multidrug effflux MFS transporter [Sphingobium boeckii]MBB5686121.1 DHA1 family bicyclomycin/chloramphenicol resistance-like MFS transporter [Sphingobium boeckii]
MHGITNPDSQTAKGPGFREFVGLMAAIMAMVALAIDSMLPALPAIGESLGVTSGNHRQFVISAFMIGFGVAQFFVGTLSDRFGRRGIMLIAMVCYTIFSIAAALAPSFEWLIAARIAQGASAAGGRVLVVSIVRDRFVGRQMARVMSLAFIVFMAAPIVAPAVGQLILTIAPWRWIFVALAAVGIAIGGWIALRLPETLDPENRLPITPARIKASYARVLSDRQSTGYTVAIAFLTGALMGFINSVQQIFSDVFQASHLLVPAFGGVAGMMALGSLFNSHFVERLGMRYIGHWAMIGFTIFAALHLISSALGYEDLTVFVILQGLMMGCFALSTANFGALAMEKVGDVAGTASSLQGSFSTIMGATIGIFVGQSFDGTTVPLYAGFTLCGTGAIIAVMITERGKLFRRSM